jgi:NADPH:quinone reductase-like Zn-dependent oxidoreductase
VDQEAAGLSTMRALVCPRYGSPDLLEFREVPKPVPGEGEVLVEIHATTVNRTDYGVLRGTPVLVRLFYGVTRPRSPILGNEYAGTIEAVGDGVKSFAVGDRVFGYNDATFGAHAEYITARETGLVAEMPAGSSFTEFAAANEGVHYALRCLRAAGVGEGDRILVYGATGAIGSAAVQLARHFGAEVTAVCGTAHVDLVRSLGADHVIDYTKDELPVPGVTYDVVMDAVGKTSYRRWKNAIVPGGWYLTTDLKPMIPGLLLIAWTRFFGERRVVLPLPKHSQETVVLFRELIEAGDFRPVIDRVYPFDEIVDAFRYVATGQKVGNVVVTMG